MKKLYLTIIIILIVASAYGYFWFTKNQKLVNEAQQLVEQSKKYESLNTAIQEELDRCDKFISQKEGDFGSFEYCQKFINWTSTLGN